MADRMAIMSHGAVEQIGPPWELYEKPANSFVARFLGEANLFRIGKIDPGASGQSRLLTEEGQILLAAGSSTGPVVCVRPENITIGQAPPGRQNCFSGRIVDIVQAAGSIRYRVAISPNCTVTARVVSERRVTVLPMDAAVHVGWDAEDTLVLPS